MKITVKGERGPQPTELPPPGDRRGTAIVYPGQLHPRELTVYVTKPALLLMLEHAVQGGAYEVGGFLLGGYHRWKGHRYVDLTTPVPALKAKSEKTHLTFDNTAQREFHAVAQKHPDKLVLGWYHTHPRYSVFLSEYDIFIQRGFFASDHHVAVVIDPYQEAINSVGVFVWESGDISTGYHMIVYEHE